jgi:hypothetical protein
MIPDANELQLLLNICDNYSKKWALEYGSGNSKLNKFNFLLNNRPLTYSINYKELVTEFDNNLNFSDFFIKKFQSVSNSFFT